MSSSESRFKTKTMSDCCHLRPPDLCIHQIFLYNLIAVVKFTFDRTFVLGFFSKSFVACHNEIGCLCHYFLLHWVSLTKIQIVCCTESLLQTFFFYYLMQWVTATWVIPYKSAEKNMIFFFFFLLTKTVKSFFFLYFSNNSDFFKQNLGYFWPRL